MRTLKPFLVVIVVLLILFAVNPSEASISVSSPEKTGQKIYIHPGIIEPARKETSLSTDSILPDRRHYIVQFSRILNDSEKVDIAGLGVDFLEYVPEKAWIVRTDGEGVKSLMKNDRVLSILPFLSTYKIDSALVNSISSKLGIKVIFFNDATENERNEVVNRYGLDSEGETKVSRRRVFEIAQFDQVQYIRPGRPGLMTLNDGSRAASEADDVHDLPYNVTGNGVTLAIWDAGVADHMDYNSRRTLGDDGSVSAHATHVAGTMLGNGSLSSTKGGTDLQWKGFAPNASLVTYEWPDTENELFSETNGSIALYDSVLSQNSWSYDLHDGLCSMLGDYDEFSQAYDNITNGYSVDGKIIVVFSAGNERVQSGAYCGNQGYGPFNSTPGPGGTAKNVIAVGAVNSNDNSMTSFSSWGPTDDGRLKPELVASGCQNGGDSGIKSTYSSDTYNVLCGTSMAAPAVSGSVGLIVEEYKRTHSNQVPLPSTIKALLVHSAYDLNETGPDFTTGYGHLNVTAAIDIVRADVSGNQYILEGNISNGQNMTYYVHIPAGSSSFRATLAWDDYPASVSASKQLVNDLDLLAYNSSGDRFFPWTLDSDSPATPAVQNASDNTNVVEQVYTANPSSGSWTIAVNGSSIPVRPEEFSLVISTKTSSIEITVDSPLNTTITDQNLDFNITLSRAIDTALFEINGENNSMANDSSTHYYNITYPKFEESRNCVDFWVNDSLNTQNSTRLCFSVDTAPYWNSNVSNIVSDYSLQASEFNITWTDSLPGMDSVYIESNWSGIENNTMSNISSVYTFNKTLPAGTHYWKTYGIDLNGNVNSTGSWIFSILKTNETVFILLNNSVGNLSINQSDMVNITAFTENSSGVAVYNNGTLLENSSATVESLTAFSFPGLYNITACFEGDENQTENCTFWWVEVNDTLKPSVISSSVFPNVLFSGEVVNVTANLSDNFNVSASWYNLSNSTWSLIGYMTGTRDKWYGEYNTSSLSNGKYVIAIFFNDSQGNQNSYSSGNFNVSSPVNVTFSISDRDGNQTNASKIQINYVRVSGIRDNSSNFVSEFSSEVPEGSWNIEVLFSDFNITFFEMELEQNESRNITVDYASTSVSGRPSGSISLLSVVALNTSFNTSLVQVILSYNTSLVSGHYISAHSCHDWNLSGRSCSGSWENITSNSTLYQSNGILIINTSNLSAFSATADYYCGDGYITSGEDCDGTNISSSCRNLGYSGGSLSCNSGCTHDLSGCTSETASVSLSGGGGPVSEEEIEEEDETIVAPVVNDTAEEAEQDVEEDVEIITKNVTEVPILICTPNERRCVSNRIERCDSDGLRWKLVSVCPLGCDDRTVTCISSRPVGRFYGFEGNFIFASLIVIIIIIGVLIIYYNANKRRKRKSRWGIKRRKKRKKKWF